MKTRLLFPVIVTLFVGALLVEVETGDSAMAVSLPDISIDVQGDPNAHDSLVTI